MKPVEMVVKLVASTSLPLGFFSPEVPVANSKMDFRQWEDRNKPSDLLAEAAGRICYDSFHLPNPKTATNEGYLANIKKQQHYTVLEHASFTFYIGNVSRALLAELTRHRHHSFSVRSQRYCDESGSDYVIPSVLLKHQGNEKVRAVIRRHEWLNKTARDVYMETQDVLTELGEKRKTANDAARYALPEGTVTEMYVTSNGNGWLSFLAKRDSEAAAEEIRMMAGKMRDELKKNSPNIFQ